MGFWDLGVGDLAAMGVNVSREQRRVLEQGGQVLFITGLLSPYLYELDNKRGVVDQNDEQIYVPQLLYAYSPSQTLPGLRGKTIRAHMDEGGTEWRAWPSYVGEIIERSVTQHDPNEDLSFVRVWDGIPLVTEEDKMIATELFIAATDRIDASVYCELKEISEYQAMGGDVDDLHLALNAADMSYDEVALKTGLSEHQIGNLVLAYDTLLLNDTGPGGYDVDQVTMAPMENYLSAEAARVWTRLVNRRENILAIVNNALPRLQARCFDRSEREYS